MNVNAGGSRANQHNFAAVPDVKMARSQFDRSHTIKDTMQFDYLIPVFVDEILPGDTCNLSANTFARLTPQVVPIMDNLYIDFFFFFVPNRLVWSNWEKFNGAQDNPGDSTSYILPYMDTTANGPEVGSIFDKMGHPTDIVNSYRVSNTLPLRAYIKIFNDWFRDENLQNSVALPIDDGPDVPGDFVLQKRGKRHDYFTSCLPWPQKGTALELPLGTSAPVLGLGITAAANTTFGATNYQSDGSTIAAGTRGWVSSSTTIQVRDAIDSAGTAGTGGHLPNIYADLSNATAATINQLREAWMLQSLLELDARGGTRYVEILRAHFNVTSPDFRLQRAEYLGGGSTRINSHPVAQTAPTSGSNYLAQLGAFSTSSTQGQSIGFTKSFVEHGYVIGLACGRADLTYQQGLNKIWNRSTRYDFFWPKLQEMGEQAVLNKEIYIQGTAADTSAFGYQERYAEYRFKLSEIRGAFRSTYPTTLDKWHMSEKFASLPALNSTFIVQTTPIDRALAVASATQDPILMDIWFQYKHTRPMMTYSVPATLGRF